MIFKIMPGLKQLVHYHLSYLPNDLTAGMVVAFLLIPQSMAYAVIAGVPVVFGLFAAIFPVLIYALFGNSRYLSVGPVSIASLLAFTGIAALVKPHSSHFFTLIILLTLIVGVVQLMLSLIKFGSFFDYISPAVISGFTSAAAVIIAITQIPAIMGVSLASFQNIADYLLEITYHLHQVNIFTVILGFSSLWLLIILKTKFHTSLGPLIVIVASIIIVYFFHLEQRGVQIIGGIPRGLPSISLQLPTFDTFLSLLPIAFMIGFISFAESYSVAKTLAAKKNEQLNPNQELLGLGLANLTSSIVGAIPVAGAISRTAVNHQSGAKSNFSLFVAAAFVLITLLYLTPLFYFLPKATLAAVIIVAVTNLINVKDMRYYLKHAPFLAIIMLSTFLATLMIDIFVGLMIGIFLSLLYTFIKTKLLHVT
ncbi:SulP family inorganic anion transporter [Lentibacillus sp. L22]|uniref:SulP family inorganic anion transporter n=1 Tax=Lentibacillus TaxID=175304 RepID=UPI0022B08588|nr:SulP family inorganic anion transporter [Lentibacillus daqui]